MKNKEKCCPKNLVCEECLGNEKLFKIFKEGLATASEECPKDGLPVIFIDTSKQRKVIPGTVVYLNN